MKPTRRPSPRLESLETRLTPTVRVSVLGSAMTVLGDNAINSIAITDNGSGGITVVGDGQTFNAVGISTLRVRAQDGNDQLSYTLSAASTGTRVIDLDLEKGDDTASVDLKAGVASGSFTFELQGNDGADALTAAAGAVAAGAIADIQVNGGKDNDVITIGFNGAVNGMLRFKGSGQDGDDTVFSEVIVAPGSTGRLDTSVRGGKGNDRLTLRVSGTAGLAFREMTLDGDDGIDTWVATANVRVRNAEVRG